MKKKVIKIKIQKFGFINGVDNVNWPPYRDSKLKADYPGYVVGEIPRNSPKRGRLIADL